MARSGVFILLSECSEFVPGSGMLHASIPGKAVRVLGILRIWRSGLSWSRMFWTRISSSTTRVDLNSNIASKPHDGRHLPSGDHVSNEVALTAQHKWLILVDIHT